MFFGRINSALHKTFYSLRNRNFRLFFIGQTISNTGNWLTNVAIVLLVLKITGSGLDVGILSACQYGPILFLSAFGGSIADKVDKRKMLLVTQGLEMAQSAALAVLAFMPHPPLLATYIVALAGGIFLAFDNPLRRSFVSEMVSREDLPNAVVLYSTIVNTSRIFGPALAGLLVVTLGYGWAFTLDALSYTAVIVCVIMMRPEELHIKHDREKVSGGVMAGVRYIFSVPVLWINFVMLAVIGTLAYNFQVTFPLFVIRALHGTEGMFTVLYSIFSFGAVICGLVVAHRKLVTMKHILTGAVLLGIAMLILAIVPNAYTAAVVIFFVGIASILYMTPTTTTVQIESKPGMHGRVLALQSVFLIGTTLIGGPFSGFLADTFGGRAPILFGGVVCLAAALFGYVATQKVTP
ncbi:MAG TPA: MFS transporter [Patescibacteria group bacterium]|nr:MFS transporter [Patescibacteria group bacterium]